jgi:hypothetical protein
MALYWVLFNSANLLVADFRGVRGQILEFFGPILGKNSFMKVVFAGSYAPNVGSCAAP